MTARDDILARIRSQPSQPRTPRLTPYLTASSLTPQQRTDLFCTQVHRYRASVLRVSHEELHQAILATTRGLRVVVAPGYPRDLWPEEPVLDEDLSWHDLNLVDGALTTATLAIADTGTIVLSSGPQEGRRAMTLIPDTHFCRVDAAQIVETVPDAFAKLAPYTASDRPVTLISGPSATSDIEMRRVEGVHGPRNLAVIVHS